MRVSEFIVSRKISLGILNLICEYLFLPYVKANTKVSEESFRLWDLALGDSLFEEWFQNKIKVDKIESDNSRRLIKELKEVANTESFTPELCQRIINSYLLLIRKSSYTTKDAEKILEIINSDKFLYEKISLLKNRQTYSEPTKIISVKTSSNRYESDYESSYDPYENFHWGGLSGEEAYIGYWNTE